MKMFVNFCESTSMHGWIFFGSANAPLKQRLFWLVVLSASLVTAALLIFLNTAAFMSSFTQIRTQDRTADLGHAYFPSVLVCNINQLRKSFIYWLHHNLGQSEAFRSTSMEDLFYVVRIIQTIEIIIFYIFE